MFCGSGLVSCVKEDGQTSRMSPGIRARLKTHLYDVFLWLIKHHARKACGLVEVELHAFLTLAVHGDE
jgi:hypothetical protein